MKNLVFFLLCLFSINSAFCQSPGTIVDSTALLNDDTVYSSVEEKPDFVGGIQEFYNYIGKNYRVPEGKGVKGKILVQFIIEKDGSLTDIKVLKDLGHGTGKEAVRILKKCPKWIPGKQKGVPVRVLYSFPISIFS